MTAPISYVGAGMSTAPKEILYLIEDAARMLAAEGIHLRTHGGQGPCEAFVRGAKDPSLYSVFIPGTSWATLNTRNPGVYGPYTEGFIDFEHATNYARKFHPSWPGLAGTVQRMMAMVSYQVLGPQLIDPALFVLCWTPNGTGGDTTGQVIRLAQAFNIPIFDLGVMDPMAAGEAIMTLLAEHAANNQNEPA